MSLLFVCLAHSRKHSKKCIAGKHPETREWIRPVSLADTEGALDDNEIENNAGIKPRVLDIVSFTKLQTPTSHPNTPIFQTENTLNDNNFYWSFTRPTINLAPLLDSPPSLWMNNSSSYSGTNDRVSAQEALTLRNSLYFIAVPSLTIEITQYQSKPKKIRGSFIYNGDNYNMVITDIECENYYTQYPVGESYTLNNLYITISLGVINPHDNYHYKLIAGIIQA